MHPFYEILVDSIPILAGFGLLSLSIPLSKHLTDISKIAVTIPLIGKYVGPVFSVLPVGGAALIIYGGVSMADNKLSEADNKLSEMNARIVQLTAENQTLRSTIDDSKLFDAQVMIELISDSDFVLEEYEVLYKKQRPNSKENSWQREIVKQIPADNGKRIVTLNIDDVRKNDDVKFLIRSPKYFESGSKKRHCWFQDSYRFSAPLVRMQRLDEGVYDACGLVK